MIRIFGCTLLAFTLIALTGCTDDLTSANAPGDETPHTLSAHGNAGNSALHQELAALRRATAKYHDVDVATDDGYAQASPFVPEMGFHYVNGSLIDGSIEVTQPEALVYDSNDPQKKQRKLGAVEYIIPTAIISDQSNLPTPFTGMTTGDWHHEEEIRAWTLHVWIWLDNPEGTFHPENPRVSHGS